ARRRVGENRVADVGDPIGPEFCDPGVAVGSEHQSWHVLVGRIWRDYVRQKRAVDLDPPDLSAVNLGEPEVPIRASGDRLWIVSIRIERRGDRILGDNAGSRDSTDFVAMQLREPDISIGSRNDVGRLAVRRRKSELGDYPGGGDSAYSASLLDKP